MNKTALNTLLSTALLFWLPACGSQRPLLSSNEHLVRVGSRVAEQDIDECMRRAEVAGDGHENRAASVAANTAGSAAVGAAAGGAGGAVVGQAGQGAAIGAASSAAATLMYGLLRSLFTSDPPPPHYRGVVNNCLRDKGYDPVEWK
jgi:outer membrane lipoprotein SlyB